MTMPVITPIKGSLAKNKDGVSAVLKYSIIADSEVDALAVLLAETGIDIFVSLETVYGETPDPESLCQSITIEAVKPALVGGGGGDGLYTVTCNFGRASADGSSLPAPPVLDGPARFQRERATVSEPVDHDVNGDPITNSAGEQFSPPLTALRVNIVVVADWIRAAADQLAADAEYQAYEGKVNSATWRGAARGSMFCHSIEPTEISPGVYRYVGRFERRAPKTLHGTDFEGWETTVLDAGLREVGPTSLDGKPSWNPIVMQGAEISKPVLLNGIGFLNDEGADPVPLGFKHYEYIDFNGIDI
jgi:hypothetical protein